MERDQQTTWPKGKATHFGEVPADVDMTRVGQDPGKGEVRQRRPFAGRAGQCSNDALVNNARTRRVAHRCDLDPLLAKDCQALPGAASIAPCYDRGSRSEGWNGQMEARRPGRSLP
ncbi:MAG: hypothetical protein DRI40_06890 [Chloroflexi bacterium]|nr:MAG: hypothetical protein DRI40_06890 [Chloroflexota bacterium]